ncbi:MAG: 23S rRNA pseudouridine(1911/1915/1917) synthase RluD, partial [Psittacicella sp.]
FPVLGDQVYGVGKRPLYPRKADQELLDQIKGFKRQALHSVYMKMNHPITNEEMSWEIPLPKDMQDLIKVLEKDFDLYKDSIY